MSAQTYLTRDHDTIRRWAQERGGTPSSVAATRTDGDPGVLRIDFPGYSGESSLEAISWEEWFAKFDDSGLVLLFQERTSGGETSNFNKLLDAATASETESNAEWIEGDAASHGSGERASGASGEPAARSTQRGKKS